MPEAADRDVAKTILDGLRARKVSGRWGIGTASAYFLQMEAGNPLKHFNVTPEEWARGIKEAERKLVYCDPGMVLLESDSGDTVTRYEASEVTLPGGQKVFLAMPKTEKRAANRPAIKGSIMEFEAIITSNRRDRDGDVLEPDGANVDPKCPLLWQHTPYQPIGRLIEVTHRGKDQVRGRFAIADTPLGRDAATLVEFGALRISHGFLPTEFEELKATKGAANEGDTIGWHVKKYDMMEISLVSVPSNVDANILQFDTRKLHHPLMKSFVEGLRRSRPVQVPGADFTKSFQHNSTVEDKEPQWGDVDKTKLPRKAFADEGDADKVSSWSYPHHWVKDGGSPDDNGRYTTGTMYLHEGGLNAAWSAANGGRSGQEASSEVKSHLQAHRKALKLDDRSVDPQQKYGGGASPAQQLADPEGEPGPRPAAAGATVPYASIEHGSKHISVEENGQIRLLPPDGIESAITQIGGMDKIAQGAVVNMKPGESRAACSGPDYQGHAKTQLGRALGFGMMTAADAAKTKQGAGDSPWPPVMPDLASIVGNEPLKELAEKIKETSGRHNVEPMDPTGHDPILDIHGTGQGDSSGYQGASLSRFLAKYFGSSLDGSHEDIRDDLQAQAYEYLRSHGIDLPKEPGTIGAQPNVWSSVNVVAVFDDLVILEVYQPGSNNELYKLAWALGADGEPILIGDPVNVELTVEISATSGNGNPKAAQALVVKAGRVLSAINEKKLVDAKENLDEAMKQEPSTAVKALIRMALLSIENVLESLQPLEDGTGGQRSAAGIAAVFLATEATEIDLRDAETFIRTRRRGLADDGLRRLIGRLSG
jgi:hypothetical protein